jgi:hypothetical protein
MVAGLLVTVACSDASQGVSVADAGGPGPCPNLQFPSACPSPPPSWKTDVEPLFVEYCETCHGIAGVAAAQVPLGSYQDVHANRTRSWVAISNCSMPNTDAALPAASFPTPTQRQTMVTWLDICNAPNN